MPVAGCRWGTELGLLSSPCRGGPSRTNRHLGRSPFFAGLFRFIPVYPGLSRSIPVYLGLFRSILVYLGLSRSIQVHPGRFRSRPVGIGRIPWSGARRLRSGRARRPGVVDGVHASIDSVYSPFRQPRPYRTPGRPWRADIAIAGQARAAAVFSPPPFFFPSPLQGGGREGGPAPGSAGVPPASREARTRVRAFGPPGRRDAGAPRQFTDERDRGGPRPGRPAPGSTPLPTSPLPGGRREDPGGRREDGAARLPVRPSRAVPNGEP